MMSIVGRLQKLTVYAYRAADLLTSILALEALRMLSKTSPPCGGGWGYQRTWQLFIATGTRDHRP
jgi:hypothetical protein